MVSIGQPTRAWSQLQAWDPKPAHTSWEGSVTPVEMQDTKSCVSRSEGTECLESVHVARLLMETLQP